MIDQTATLSSLAGHLSEMIGTDQMSPRLASKVMCGEITETEAVEVHQYTKMAKDILSGMSAD